MDVTLKIYNQKYGTSYTVNDVTDHKLENCFESAVVQRMKKIFNDTIDSVWNYVKTINCNFEGDIPQTDLRIIKTMFDNGVTLWHNPATIYNYNASNNII